MDELTTQLLQYPPALFFIAVILLSYLLEDLAIVTAAIAASEGVMPVQLALLAIFVGIATGDLGLYGLGMLAHRWRPLRAFLLTKSSMRYVRHKLRANAIANIFVIRFVPGLRFVGFCLSGFFRIDLLRFMVAVMAATAIWTAVVFLSVYQLGSSQWVDDNLGWWLLPVMVAVLYVINRWAGRKVKGKAICTD